MLWWWRRAAVVVQVVEAARQPRHQCQVTLRTVQCHLCRRRRRPARDTCPPPVTVYSTCVPAARMYRRRLARCIRCDRRTGPS